ncbi:MAG: PEP-CTERM sorting domain-containing protein [Planctomycetota bacterium]
MNPLLSLRRNGIKLAGVVGVTLVSLSANALIVQPGGPGESLPTDLPLDAIGKWGNNAAAVAVAPGWVLTTRHQDVLNNPPDRNVVFDGVTYVADTDAQITFGDNIDLRLVPIFENGEAATLSSFVGIYDGTISPRTTTTVLVGFGPTIGEADTDGFDWAGSLNANNGLNVGQNRINTTDTISGGTYSGMSVLVADFDRDGTLGPNGAVEFEATASFGDSGGSWFVNDNGTWKVAGLTHAIEIDGDDDGIASTTNDDYDAQAFYGQKIFATDLTGFASDFIVTGDYNGNGLVDAADYTIWADTFGSTLDLAADGNGNGVVDAADYTIWADNFGSTLSDNFTSLAPVPEPGTSALVLSGLMWGLSRRRSRA